MRVKAARILLVVVAVGQVGLRSVIADTTSQQKWVITPGEAKAYVQGELAEIMEGVMADRSYPTGISQRVGLLWKEFDQGRLTYEAEPFFDRPNPQNLMAISFDPKGKVKPTLLIFVPAIEELQHRERGEDFVLHIAMYFATEYLHLIKPEDLSPEQIEARDWPIVITEMVRPALKQGRTVAPIYHYLDQMFSKVNDDPNDPRWIKAFAHYFDPSSPILK